MRPLWQEFPTDINTFAIDNQFMFGEAILVAPKLEAKSSIAWSKNFLTSNPEEEDDNPINFYLPEEALWYFYPKKTV